MLEKSLQITILTDKSSWMNRYNMLLKSNLEKLGHVVNLTQRKEDIVLGNVAFFLSCFEIVGKEFLHLNRHNIVVHASDLPAGKGWSPATWQILEGKNKIPITLFEANALCDDGDYYIKDVLCLDGHELIDEWQDKLGGKIIEMCLEFINEYALLLPKPQTGEDSFYQKRKSCDSELDINKSIKEQFQLFRVVDNERYPAFFYYNGLKYVVKIYKE